MTVTDVALESVEHLDFAPPCWFAENDENPCPNGATWIMYLRRHDCKNAKPDKASESYLICDEHHRAIVDRRAPGSCGKCLSLVHLIDHVIRFEPLHPKTGATA